MAFPKKNYSSTEMKKMQIFQKNILQNKNYLHEFGIISGIGIK